LDRKMIRPRGEEQVQGLVHRSGSRHARGAALCVAALIAVLPRLAGSVAWSSAGWPSAGWLLEFTSPAYAKDGGDRHDGGGGGDGGRNRGSDHGGNDSSDNGGVTAAPALPPMPATPPAEDHHDSGGQSSSGGNTQPPPTVTQHSDDNSNQGSSGNSGQHQSSSSNENGDSSHAPQPSSQSGGLSTSSNNHGNSGESGDGHGGGNQPTASRNETDKSGSGKDGNKGNDGAKDDNQASNHDDQDNRPPATVEQWLKQLTSPKPSHDHEHEHEHANTWTTETKPGAAKSDAGKTDPGKSDAGKTVEQSGKSKPGLGKPDTTKTATGKSQTGKQQSAKSSAVGAPPPITLPDLATPDVLAVNASAQTIARAKALGFKTRPATKFANINIAVTALIPPDGMGPIEAQELLNRTMPQSSFEYNKKYRIYRTASGTETPQPGTRAAALHTPGTPSDCSGDHCFGRDIIGWKPEMRSCVNGVRIGIIDTSVDVTHPAFANKKLEVHHFGSDGAPAGPDWHGTGVTALLAGDASSGTPGMIPDANFFVADIFHADSDHEPASDTMSMLRAFDWLDAKGVKIVNMSLSGPSDDLIHKAIEKLTAKGVLFVAAAGNEGPNASPSYPAAYEQVIAVTAVTKDLQSYRYANRGSYIDVAAPGVAIWTALPGSKEGYHSGTSFATPYVTASLAAIYPKLAVKTQVEALKLIQYKDLGEPGRDPIYGQGLLVAPTSCSSGQIAAAPQSASAPGLTGAMRATSNPAEPLPWLTFQSQ
jgi:hypothetical protein